MLKLSERRVHKMKLDVRTHSREYQLTDIPRRSIIVSFGNSIHSFRSAVQNHQLRRVQIRLSLGAMLIILLNESPDYQTL